MTDVAGPPVNWQRVAITVRERPIADAQGRAPIFPNDAAGNAVHFPLAVGATIYQWCAPRPAEAWAAIAHALLEDVATINALSASHDVAAQYAYMERICTAIRNYYNCLNTVWWNDPIARACYRKWIAGPPFLVAGESNISVFRNEKSYGGAFGWFVPDYVPAVLYSRLTIPTDSGRTRLPASAGVAPPGGIIPRLTRTLFDRFYAMAASITNDTALYHRVLFVPAVGFTLVVAPETESVFQQTTPSGQSDNRPLSVEVSNDVQNDFWLNFRGRGGCPAQDGSTLISAYPVLCDIDPENMDQNVFRRLGGFILAGGGPRSYGPNGQPTGIDDWFNFRFMQAPNELNPNVELPAAAGAAEYLPYLREWMAAVVQRSAEDAILDSRAFVVYQNYEQVKAAGSVARLMQAVLTTSDDIISQQTQRDPGLETAAQAAFAIGGALATSTYGISALVGGAIGAGLMVADASLIKPVVGHGKDDLGRWKPVFDRACLSGDPNSTSPRYGAPHFVVESPPGFAAPTETGHRVINLSFLGSSFTPVVMGADSEKLVIIQPPLSTPAPGTPGYVSPPKKSKVGWIAAGVLALGAAAWKFTRKS